VVPADQWRAYPQKINIKIEIIIINNNNNNNNNAGQNHNIKIL
jgi:hypothetical protein